MPKGEADYKRLMNGLVTAEELSKMFKIGMSAVRSRLGDLEYETLGRFHLYPLARAVELVQPVPEDMIHRVMQLNHMDLPKSLSKEYWIGQAQMLKVKEVRGQLWGTDAVVDLFATTLKEIRDALLLMRDQVERRTGLTEEQGEMINSITDAAMESMRVRLSDFLAENKRRQGVSAHQDPDSGTEGSRRSITGELIGPEHPAYDL